VAAVLHAADSDGRKAALQGIQRLDAATGGSDVVSGGRHSFLQSPKHEVVDVRIDCAQTRAHEAPPMYQSRRPVHFVIRLRAHVPKRSEKDSIDSEHLTSP
jgi:hypothetical protein